MDTKTEFAGAAEALLSSRDGLGCGPAAAGAADDQPREAALAARYTRVRAQTDALTAGLSAEDCLLQSMPDASPVKWHLAHTSWFFETFVLERIAPEQPPYDARFRVLFNSYYVGVGARHPRPERGLISRPSLDQVRAYRRAIDERLLQALATRQWSAELLDLVELGIQHEQQHQELILTDLKHHFWRSPLRPAYRAAQPVPAQPEPLRFHAFEGGLAQLGCDSTRFCFDNERPRHRAWLEPFELASRLVSKREYAAFIADGGYRRPELWLSDGWDLCQREAWRAPLYWTLAEGATALDAILQSPEFTLAGERLLQPHEPVCHVSYYEAEAYARWAGARLPSEAQWEHAAKHVTAPKIEGSFLEDAMFHPCTCRAGPDHVGQLFGDCWEWTQSAYLPYPGYQPAAGAVGEYNGKFMINQMVLRGGSCASPREHLRASYRNFFPPAARWQFSGIRLARSAED
jgi:ergothioneine biosynthesis protein EgtB